MSTLTPAQRVAAYIRLRDHRAAAEAEFKKSLERTVQAMQKLEGDLLQDLMASGANSLSCDAGTVYRNVSTSATVANRDEFMKHVRGNDLWDALDVRANKTFIREYMESHKESFPGVKISQMATVGVRRS